MSSKLLYAATMGLALASAWAQADEPATASAAVTAVASHAGRPALHHSDYDDELAARPAPGSRVARGDVVAALKARPDPRLVGPLRSKTYNPFGNETMHAPTCSRADVKAEVLAARADHALRPAGEAGDQAVAMAPRRDMPRFVGLRRSGS